MTTANREKSTTIAGLLILLSMVAGILSIADAIDAPEYLVKASADAKAVRVAAFFHFLMAPIYAVTAFLLYPALKKTNQWLALGYVAFRIGASVFVAAGVIVMLMLLSLSQDFVRSGMPDVSYYQTMGGLLQLGRDLINHVATILFLSFGGLLFYALLLRGRLVPPWLSIWGLIGTLLAMIASYLVMFQSVTVISHPYIAMNVPMALQEVVLGFWLMIKGLAKPSDL